MRRGRTRRLNPNIPAHIDQTRLPSGMYWAHSRWYVLETDPKAGRKQKKTVVWEKATLAELRQSMVLREEKKQAAPGTLRHVSLAFQDSTEFRELALRQKDYKRLSEAACNDILREGSLLGEQVIDQMTVPSMQRLVEIIAGGRPATQHQPEIAATPTKANQIHAVSAACILVGGTARTL